VIVNLDILVIRDKINYDDYLYNLIVDPFCNSSKAKKVASR